MIYQIENDKIRIKVKSIGAELSSIYNFETKKEYLYQADEKYWTGQAPILFPIIGVLPDDKCIIHGKKYEMGAHGFVKNKEFTLYEQTSDTLTFLQTDDEISIDMYPFQFQLFVSYKLVGNTVINQYKVVNKDEKEMIFSIGGHPAFACKGEYSDYYLEFEKKETLLARRKTIYVLPEKYEFMTDEDSLALSHDMFYDGAILFEGLQSTWIDLKNKNDATKLRISFEGFTHFGIWSSENDGPYVCLEPWLGTAYCADESLRLDQKDGMIYLDADKEFTCSFSMTAQ